MSVQDGSDSAEGMAVDRHEVHHRPIARGSRTGRITAHAHVECFHRVHLAASRIKERRDVVTREVDGNEEGGRKRTVVQVGKLLRIGVGEVGGACNSVDEDD